MNIEINTYNALSTRGKKIQNHDTLSIINLAKNKN